MRGVTIHSIGVIGPGAADLEQFRSVLYRPRKRAERDESHINIPPRRLKVDDREWNHGIGNRLARRIDRFSQLALYAVARCLADGGPALGEDRSRIGLCIGNNYGGWSYVEPMMPLLYQSGMNAINPYVATAWFPAAAQGEISIKYGLKGISKTFSAERLSAAYAIEYGKLLVDHGRLEVALAGGVESPFSQPVLASMRNLGLLSSDVPAGEAACMIGFGRQTDGCKPRILGFGKAMAPSSALAQSLQNAEITPSQLDLVLLDPPRGLNSFRRRHLAVQLTAIQELKAPAVQVAQPLPFGETVGAAFAIQLAAAVIALEQQQIPVSDFDAGSRDELQTYGFAVNCNQKIDLTNVAVLGSDGYGQWMSCMVANA